MDTNPILPPNGARTAIAAEYVAAPRLLDLLPEYEGHLLGKGHRPRGIQKYIWNLKAIIRWFGTDATVADLTEDRILAYRDWRAGQAKPSTVFNDLVCIRSLCQFLLRRKRMITEDPTQYVDYPKVPKPSPRALTRAQLKRMFEIIDTEPAKFKPNWRRNRIVLLLMVYTGLRISEASGLLWKDVDLDAGVIVVRPEIAKNGKTRAIPIHPRLKDELAQLGTTDPEASVIYRVHGSDANPMGPKCVSHIFERWLTAQGLTITPHQLRHTLATELLRGGAKLTDIQNILGHDSIETTAIYLTIDAEHLRTAINVLPAGW